MAVENVRLVLKREDRPDAVIFVGARTKSDAAIGVLQMLLPKLGFMLVLDDRAGFGSFNTGKGDAVMITREPI